MDHRFTGPAYTLGIEEELMILDEQTLELSNSIESLLAAAPPVEGEPQLKEELMESVVEIMTTPCGSMPEVSEQLRGLRRQV
ncbi:MAG TPA: glutamate-cysteine ligase family protein, partial [Thermoleophilaceae bacterium]|nr:glutamate-cysteine ligase family protein [Thermoleophilaceae bacterium]